MTGRPELQPDLEKLAQKILSLEKPVLGSQKKNILKNNILKNISAGCVAQADAEFAGLVAYIRRLAGLLKPDTRTRVVMKENVFAVVERIPQRSFFIQNLFALHKRLISGAVVVALFLGMFSYVNVDTSVVMAQTFTTLESFTGEVHVVRNGVEANVYGGMDIVEGDRIFTGSDGMVVVKYFGDSITRLAADTDVVINRLFRPEGSVETYVEVSLVDGVVWSRVLSLVGDQSAFVLKANDVSATTKKATFNVELRNQKLELEVFNRSVDVRKNDQVARVMKGQKAVVNGDVKVKKLVESERNEAWVKTNLESDKQYLAVVEDRLLDAKIKSMGSDVSLGNSFREDVAVFLTFNDVDKQKKELDLAEKDLVAAEIKLSDPNLSADEKARVEEVLASFSARAKDFNDLVRQVGYSDKEYAEELKLYLDNKILAHQKELSVILPDSPLYVVKKVVDDAALANIEDKAELVEKKLDQVSEKLATAEDAAALGQTGVALAVVDDSKRELNNVVQILDTMEQKTPEAVETLAPKVDEVKQYLTAVSTDPVVTAVETSVPVVTSATATTTTEPVTATTQTVASPTTPVTATTQVVQPTTSVIPEQPVDDPVDTTTTQSEYGVYMNGDKPLPPGLGREN